MNDVIKEIHALGGAMQNAIISDITAYKSEQKVVVDIVCEKVFSSEEKKNVLNIIRKYVPSVFNVVVNIKKLTPDEEIVKDKILTILRSDYSALSATLLDEEVTVNRTDDGFYFEIRIMNAIGGGNDILSAVTCKLQKTFCGKFVGKVLPSERNADDIKIEEKEFEDEYDTPVRSFEIVDFSPLEGGEPQNRAVYLSDFKFIAEDTVVCGVITFIQEREYTRKDGKKMKFFSISLNDKTATVPMAYFLKQSLVPVISNLKEGDSIVAHCKSETKDGMFRINIQKIDYGKQRSDFVKEELPGKPVPKYYKTVFPQQYTDRRQDDFFETNYMPECLRGKQFVVLDLETTGLNYIPSSGAMDKIIEIGAYKVVDGVIQESFTTFVNPQTAIPQKIVELTGITQDMVKDAPVYQDVMPDFYKFCAGSILVGHNIAGFDFHFIDYYFKKCGYVQERKLIDTVPLAHETVYLNNYKLNTLADYFKITFNHHRAIDDALVTAEIFIELIKIKKSLPRLL